MDVPRFSLNGKVALVTGGSRGIGLAIAVALADAGADVVISGRKQPDLEKAAEEIATKGGKVLADLEIPDAGKPSDAECPCGRGLPLFGSIEGRVPDFIVTGSGDLISPGFFGLLFQEAKGIRGYQVVQEVKGKALVRYVAGPEFSEKELEKITAAVHKNSSDLEMDFKRVEEIAPEKSGKRRFTISKVKAGFL